MSGRVRFDNFEADLASGELWRAGAVVPVQDLPFRLLTALLERPGEIVTRAELSARLWGSETFVDAGAGLNTAVAKLRDALDDNADRPIFIETVPKRGYRFVAAVEPATAPAVATAESTGSVVAAVPTSRKWRVGTIVAAAAVMFVAVAAFQLRAELGRVRGYGEAVRVAVVLFDNETERPQLSRFAQGLTDAVVTELTKDRRLAVIGNAAVLRTERPFRDIAKVRDELDADFIVIGQVQARDAATIVRAHLIRANDQAHVWVDVVELTAAGETAFQSTVAGKIRSAIATHALAR